MMAYLKCWYYNRFSFFGTLILGLSVAVIILDNRASVILIFVVIGLLATAIVVVTDFGHHTYSTYCRALEHKNTHGSIDEIFVDVYGSFYCDRVGIELARRASP